MLLTTSLALAFCTAPVVLGTVVPRGLDKDAGYGDLPDKDKPLFAPAGYSYVPYDPTTSSTSKEMLTLVRPSNAHSPGPSTTYDKDNDKPYSSQPPHGDGTSYGQNIGTPIPLGPSALNIYDPSTSYGNDDDKSSRGPSTYSTASSRSRSTGVSYSSSDPTSPYDKDSEESSSRGQYARSSTRSASQTRGSSTTTAVSYRASEDGDSSSTYDNEFDGTYDSGRPTRSNASYSSQTAVTPTSRAGYRSTTGSYEATSSDSSDDGQTSYRGQSSRGSDPYGSQTGSSRTAGSSYPASTDGPSSPYDKDSDKTSSRGRSTRSGASYGSQSGARSTTTGPGYPASSSDPSGSYDQTYRRQPSYDGASQSTEVQSSSYEPSIPSYDKDSDTSAYRGRTTRSSLSYGSQSSGTSTTGSDYPSPTEDPSTSYDSSSRGQTSYRGSPSQSKPTSVRASAYGATLSYDGNSDKSSRGGQAYTTESSDSSITDTGPSLFVPFSSYDGDNSQSSRRQSSSATASPRSGSNGVGSSLYRVSSYDKDDDKTSRGRASYSTVSSPSDVTEASSSVYNPPYNGDNDKSSNGSPPSYTASSRSRSATVSSPAYDPSSPNDKDHDTTYTGRTPSDAASSGSRATRTGYSATQIYQTSNSPSTAHGTVSRGRSSSTPTGVPYSVYDPSTPYDEESDESSHGQSSTTAGSSAKSTRTGYSTTNTSNMSVSQSRNYGTRSSGQHSPSSETTGVGSSAYSPSGSYGAGYGETSGGESSTASYRSRSTGLGSSGSSYGRPSSYDSSDETSRGRSSYVTASSRSPNDAVTSSGSIYDSTLPYGQDSDKTYRRQLSYSTASSGSPSSAYDPSSTYDEDSDKSSYRGQSIYGSGRLTVSYLGGNPIIPIPTGPLGVPAYQSLVSSEPGATGQYSSASGRNSYATDKDGNPVFRSTARTSQASRVSSGSTAGSSATGPRLTLSAGSTPQSYGASATPSPVYDPSYVYDGNSQSQAYTNSDSPDVTPRPASPDDNSDEDRPSRAGSESLSYYESGATALSHLPVPYPTSSMAPVFTPDTLGSAYGGGYWGVPLTYVSSDSARTGASKSGIPIGYTATGGPYTPIPTIPNASSSLSKATELLHQSLCAYGDPACQQASEPVPIDASASYATTGSAGGNEAEMDPTSSSISGPPVYTTITGRGYTSVYSLAYGTKSCEEAPTNGIVIYGSVVPSSSSGPGSTGYSVPAKDLPHAGYSKNSTNLAARTAPPGYLESKGHRVVYASSLVIAGMLAVLLVL
ncbi:MAG: hypothetical protein M1816_005535 [Peltula sp. TS41687]|nr:MAG: hypothetical protein M1816_005535 [Peltula sp. TS41687]